MRPQSAGCIDIDNYNNTACGICESRPSFTHAWVRENEARSHFTLSNAQRRSGLSMAYSNKVGHGLSLGHCAIVLGISHAGLPVPSGDSSYLSVLCTLHCSRDFACWNLQSLYFNLLYVLTVILKCLNTDLLMILTEK